MKTKTLRNILLVSSIMQASIQYVAASNPEPVQWAENGHYYQKILLGGNVTWNSAQDWADDLWHNGVRGHLVVINSESENEWIRTEFLSSLSDSNGIWIGGSRDVQAVSSSEGWSWINGEIWGYQNWRSGEPDETAPNPSNKQWPNRTVMKKDGTWVDQYNSTKSDTVGFIIVEYSTRPLPSVPHTVVSSEDFESDPNLTWGQSEWFNWDLGPIYNADWSLGSGGTPTSGTGPNVDGYGDSSGNYVYVESSVASSSVQEAGLHGPLISSYESDVFLGFSYHMHGSDMGVLEVWVHDTDEEEDFKKYELAGELQLSESEDFGEGLINLGSFEKKCRVTFLYKAAGGDKGDIALDNLYIYLAD